MKSKKILPVVLAAFSCLPSVSALEKKDSNATKSDSSKANGAISHWAAGGIGFVTGAATFGLSSGLGVRHFKNKEIETEKSNAQNDINQLKEKIKQLEQERDTLRQENENFKSKLIDFRNKNSVNPNISDNELISKLFDTFYQNDKAYKVYSAFIGSLNGIRQDAKYLLKNPSDCGLNDNTQISPLNILSNPKFVFSEKNVSTVSANVYWYITRCMAALLEAAFEDKPDPSVFVEGNYNFDKANEEEFTLKPKLLEIDDE